VRRLDIFKTELRGRQLIEASAGTGKTYTITYLYLRLILERGLSVERILVVTYTEAATAELKQRLRQALRQAQLAFDGRLPAEPDPNLLKLLETCSDHAAAARTLDKAVKSFDEAAVFTIHGFCQRMLTELAFESGVLFDTELISDQSAFIQEVADDFVRLNSALPGWLSLRLAALNAGNLSALLKRVSLDADLAPRGPRPAIEAQLEEVDRLRQALAAEWQNSRTSLSEWLRTSPALNRQSYNQSRVAKLIAGLDSLSASPAPLAFERFELLTLDGLKLKGGQQAPEWPLFRLAQDYWAAENRLRAVINDFDVWLKVSFVDYARIELERRKEASACLHFDDLLLAMRRASSNPGFVRALRGRFDAALIDEFQDTDPTQYAIFDQVFDAEASLFMIGDPKQAIYAFRGADIFTYLAAKQAVADENRHTLPVNHRSAPELVAAVNRFFERNQRAFVFEGIDFEPVTAGGKAVPLAGQAALTCWLMPEPLVKQSARELIAAAVASEIVNLLNSGLAAPGAIAVLVRSNSEARLVRDCLAALTVPCVLETDESVFDTLEAAELLQVLAAVAQPARGGLVWGALITSLLGLSPRALEELRQNEETSEAALNVFSELNAVWQRRGFFAVFAALLESYQVRERLLAQPLGERRLTNLLQLAELIGGACQEQSLSPDGALKWLGTRLNRGDKDESYLLRLESDAEAVRIQTMHKSKGLEYDIVFCPFVWGASELRKGGVISCHTPDGRIVDLGSAELAQRSEAATLEALAENMRLLYVALTRAKRKCYLAYGPVSGFETSALAWLLHGDGLEPEFALTSLRELKKRPFAELAGDLTALASEVLSITQLPAASGEAFSTAAAGGELACRSFSRRLDLGARLTSFTALSAGANHAADHDDLARPAPAEPGLTIFSFERGARAGTMLHKIFEDVDFQAAADERHEKVGEVLGAFGYGAEWTPVIAEMLAKVLAAELAPGLRLADVPRAARLSEMEFFYPLGLLEPGRLDGFFEGLPAAIKPADLDFKPVGGRLHGFIDLVFRHGGRYYIVDWKSNHLGDRAADYAGAALNQAMAANCYTLQYYLYTVALDRYLKLRLPDYSYAEHFGGVFYVFLRGVDSGATGVFSARPTTAELERLNEVLSGI